MTYALYLGDCIETMRRMPEASVDAIVTDPPYELTQFKRKNPPPYVEGSPFSRHRVGVNGDSLPGAARGFMGKTWDGTGVAFDPACWAEVLRVLKPGGHLLAFGGTRTSHRMVCAIEDAGFEIRDSMHWFYGTGFPKSTRPNISPTFCQCGETGRSVGCIDRSQQPLDRNGTEAGADDGGPLLGGALRSTRTVGDSLGGYHPAGGFGDAHAQAVQVNAQAFPPSPECVRGRSRFAVPGGGQGVESTHSPFQAQCSDLPSSPDYHHLADPETCAPERIQESTSPAGTSGSFHHKQGMGRSGPYATGLPLCRSCGKPNADGLGTALKPAHEPIVLARKPLEGTVAANVLAHGTGAINIDACRIATEENLNGGAYAKNPTERHDGAENWRFKRGGGRTALIGDEREGAAAGMFVPGAQVDGEFIQPVGRWPANVLLDEAAAAELDEQSGELAPGNHPAQRRGIGFTENGGGASRFFYTLKPSRKERDAGCQHLPLKSAGETVDREEGSDGLNSPRAGAGRTSGARNVHPTVKPVDLMRYLCRLITPPGGIVLDPFLGSGTTGIAALAEGFRFIGIEKEVEYLAIANARIHHHQENP